MIASGKNETGTLLANCGDKQFLGNQEAFSGDFFVVNGRQDPCTSDQAFTLDCQSSGNTNVLYENGNIINKTDNSGGDGMGVIADGTSYTLTATNKHAVVRNMQIRRLTPLECERLQGFPDNHTLIPYESRRTATPFAPPPLKPSPDRVRYKALGNSMAVPVMRWIGERIQQVSEID